MPAFEHEGPFVFQLKSSLALGRGGGWGWGRVLSPGQKLGPETRTKPAVGDRFQNKTPNVPASR